MHTRHSTIRRLIAIGSVGLLALAACGSDDTADPGGTDAPTGTTAESPAATTAKGDTPTETSGDSPTTAGPDGEYPPMKIAVVLPSTADQFGISRGIVRAMDLLQEERGGPENFEVAYSENMFVVDDAAAAIRDYASRGFDVVLATSSAYGSSIAEIAPSFPEVSFVWGTNPDTLEQPNVYAFSAHSDQGGYIGGLVAGMMADKAAFVGPIDVGSIAGSADGWAAGVAVSGSSNAETFTNSFSDATLAAAAANTMVSSGVTVIGTQTEMGAGVASVAEASGGSVSLIGFDADWTPAAPNATILSLDFRYEVALREILKKIDGGQLGGEVFWIDIPNGGIEPVWNDANPVPPEVKAAAEEAVDKITSGELDVASLAKG